MFYAVMFPGIAFVVALIIGVIIVMLKYGPQICGVRHHAVPDDREWEEQKAYEQGISYA